MTKSAGNFLKFAVGKCNLFSTKVFAVQSNCITSQYIISGFGFITERLCTMGIT